MDESMTNVLIYWRDFKRNCKDELADERAWFWHSNASLIGGLHGGDRLWFVTSGKILRHEVAQAGFLVGLWRVQEVIANPCDDPAYPADRFRYRAIADSSASFLLDDPVFVDHLVRPAGRDSAVSIGRFLQGPRKLKDETVRLLQAAAGPQLARQYLSGRQA
jgi:hypothetical protein